MNRTTFNGHTVRMFEDAGDVFFMLRDLHDAAGLRHASELKAYPQARTVTVGRALARFSPASEIRKRAATLVRSTPDSPLVRSLYVWLDGYCGSPQWRVTGQPTPAEAKRAARAARKKKRVSFGQFVKV